MAGMGPAPKPDAERRRTNSTAFGWTELPVVNEAPAPGLPATRIWQPATEAWWVELWRKPQASQWDQTGTTLHTLAALQDDLFAGRAEAVKVSAEMRQHEDRHGLNPKAMLQLRWRVVGTAAEQPAPAAKRAAKKTDARRKAALQVIEGG